MNQNKEYTYLMELFDKKGKQVKKTSDLLTKENIPVNSNNPMFYAAFKVTSADFIKKCDFNHFKVLKTLMDENFQKVDDRTEEMVLCFFESQEIASEIALELGLETYYWFDEDTEWPLSTEEDIFRNPVEDEF
jgi:hypothetical protein